MTQGNDAIIATTGYTGRTLCGLDDRPNQIYMVGSMGCASSMGLGVALSQPERRVVVLDGDGAALMRMGAMATVGYERPSNLVHILLDNEMHESTGGQSTVSHSVALATIAAGCGSRRVVRKLEYRSLCRDSEQMPARRSGHVVRAGAARSPANPSERCDERLPGSVSSVCGAAERLVRWPECASRCIR
jgi:thiamine pyrophosphate-dependent acetolactate synthase large subunit-like protein